MLLLWGNREEEAVDGTGEEKEMEEEDNVEFPPPLCAPPIPNPIPIPSIVEPLVTVVDPSIGGPPEMDLDSVGVEGIVVIKFFVNIALDGLVHSTTSRDTSITIASSSRNPLSGLRRVDSLMN